MAKEKIEKQILLLNISNNYKTGMSANEAVCRAWKGKPKLEVEYALAIASGQAKGMFYMSNWRKDDKAPDRWRFDTKEAPREMYKKYENERFRMYGPMGYTSFR